MFASLFAASFHAVPGATPATAFLPAVVVSVAIDVGAHRNVAAAYGGALEDFERKVSHALGVKANATIAAAAAHAAFFDVYRHAVFKSTQGNHALIDFFKNMVAKRFSHPFSNFGRSGSLRNISYVNIHASIPNCYLLPYTTFSRPRVARPQS